MPEMLRVDGRGNPIKEPRPTRVEVHPDGSMTIFVDPRLFQVNIAGGHSDGTTIGLMTKVLITHRYASDPPASRPTEMHERISAAIAAESGGESA